MTASPDKQSVEQLGLVLPGGGARAAYQVGVLKGIAEIKDLNRRNPFGIICGTSAGGINAAVLAANAYRLGRGVKRLEGIWRNFRVEQVFRCDPLTLIKSGARVFGALMSGGAMVDSPRALLDNKPLRDLLERHLNFSRVQQCLDNGCLQAVCVTASAYTYAHSISFFQGNDSLQSWIRERREGHKVALTLDHLMATSALPMVFPPVKIRGEYYGDGAIRQLAPLSPAIRLGATKLLVIGVRNEDPNPIPDAANPAEFPSFGQITGYLLDTLFSDGLQTDLENLKRINALIEKNPEGATLKPIEHLVISPSRDIRTIAARYVDHMPRSLRIALKSIGLMKPDSRLTSFLLFEAAFTRELIDLGYHDALKNRDALLAFLNRD